MSWTDQHHPSRFSDETFWSGTRLPLASAKTLPAAAYTDQEFFRVERDRVFHRGWVCVGTAGELSKDRLLVRSIGGTSLLLSVDDDGRPHAFLNSCRHRGTELASQDCDLKGTIRCPYHRWAYRRDGTLLATPLFDEAGIDDFDPAEFGLVTVRVETWGCLIFVCLDEITMPLADWLGDLGERTAGYGLDGWRIHDSATVSIHANWKLISENYQEYYHLKWVHPELAKVSRVKDHYRFQGPGMYCGQTTTPVSGEERDDWTALPMAPGLNPSDSVSGRFLAIFPNVLLSILPNHVFVLRLEPVAPGHTIEHCTWLLPAGGSEVSEKAFGGTRTFWLSVNQEDIDIVERGQRGLERGGFTQGRLSPRFEEPLHRFHTMLADRFVGLERIPDGDPNDYDPRLGTGANPMPYRPLSD